MREGYCFECNNMGMIGFVVVSIKGPDVDGDYIVHAEPPKAAIDTSSI